MRIEFERFLMITAVLAGAGGVVLACSSENVDTTNTGTGGAVGAGGKSTGGSSGKGGSSGTGGGSGTGGSSATDGSGGAATGGSAGTATGGSAGTTGGSGGTATGGSAGSGGDASACLGDTAGPEWDGSTSFCQSLPYFNQTCTGGNTPLAVLFCNYMDQNGRDGVVAALATCLSANAGDQCDDAIAQPEVDTCVGEVFPLACGPVGIIPFGDGGTTDCATIASYCSAEEGGTAGITELQCEHSLAAFTPQARTTIVNCYVTSSEPDCAVALQSCVFNY